MLTHPAYQPRNLQGVFSLIIQVGYLISETASRLDAFSGYPDRT